MSCSILRTERQRLCRQSKTKCLATPSTEAGRLCLLPDPQGAFGGVHISLQGRLSGYHLPGTNLNTLEYHLSSILYTACRVYSLLSTRNVGGDLRG